MRIATKEVLSSQATTGTTAYTSSALKIEGCLGYCGVITTTGTLTGTAKIQGSIDGTTFVDLANSGSTANVAISGAASYVFNVADAFYNYVRVVYTNATNTGVITVTLNAKGV
jgi:hypothetical protein